MKFYRFFILCLLATPLFSGCAEEVHGEEHHKVAHKCLVTQPVIMDTMITNSYVCQIHSIRNIELRALEEGYIQDIFVDEGQFVKKGQRMFQIMPMLYQAELQKAEAEAKFAEIEYLNTKALADSNVVSPNELALAKAKLDKAQAELALAKVHLDFTHINAPFDGIMDRLHIRQGSLVEEGELLTSLSDNSEMWIYFNVPEAEYLDYQLNAKKGDMTQVQLQLANGQLFEYPGVVKTIEAEFNHETGNIPFRATFPNPKGLLRHGETGNILMPVRLDSAMLIPQKATYEVLDKRFVYVVDKENVIHSRQITIGEEMPHLYVVQGGLEPTDRIVLEGLRKVKENDEITPEFREPQKVLTELDLYAE